MIRHALARIAAPTVLLLAAATAAAQTVLPETPPDAQPGECFGFVYVPPQTVAREEQVLLKPASERFERTPAVYEFVEETVTLPAGKRRRVVKPAVTEVVEATVKVPGGQQTVSVPATYKTVTETRTVETGAVLKSGTPLGTDDSGAAICLVPTPTAQETIQKRVVDRPASTRTVQRAAKERVVKRHKVITPAVTEWVEVPARTITRHVKKLVTPAGQRAVPVPAQYQTVQRKDVVSAGHTEWRRVLCDTNFTPSLIQQLQLGLRDQAGYTGPVDGRMNQEVVTSVRRFQEREGLATGGGLTLETLYRLGITVSEPKLADRPSFYPAAR